MVNPCLMDTVNDHWSLVNPINYQKMVIPKTMTIHPMIIQTGCGQHGQPDEIDGQPYGPMDYLDVGDYVSDGYGKLSTL